MLRYILICIILFFASSCTKGIEDHKVLINNNDKNEDAFSLDSSVELYDLFYDVISADQALIIEKIDMPHQINGFSFGVIGLYDDKNIIIVLYDDKYIHEGGLYNFENNTYTTMYKRDDFCDRNICIDENTSFAIYAFNEDYIIFHKSVFQPPDFMEALTSLYSFSIADKEFKEIFQHSVDPATERAVHFNWNDILLLHNKVYFDDFYLDSEDNIAVALYSYDLTSDTLELVADAHQNPLAYDDTVIAFTKNEQGEIRSMKCIYTGHEYVEVSDYLMRGITTNDFSIFCTVNSYTCHEMCYTLQSIKDLVTGDKLLTTSVEVDLPDHFRPPTPIDTLVSSNYFLGWRNFFDGKPLLFDFTSEQFLLFTEVEPGLNCFYLKDDYGFLYSYNLQELPDRTVEQIFSYYFFKHK